MKFILTSVVAAALAGLANAVSFTNSDYSIVSGVPFTLKWSGASGPVTITLKTGPSQNLKDVQVLDSGETGESFTWTPPSSLTTGTYAFEIKDSVGSNYSPQFEFSGSASASASTDSASSTATTVTSTSGSSTVTTTSTSASDSSSSSSSDSSSTTSSASSSSASATTTTSHSSTTASRTSSASASSTTAPNSNGAQSIVMPFAVPMLVAAGVAYFN